MREGLFSAIVASEGSLAGRRFLDLYAGSGAVGLEAWSRGAARVLFVEHDRRAVGVLRDNVAALGAGDDVRVRSTPVERLALGEPPRSPYDVVFADPPYSLAEERVVGVLDALRSGGWIAGTALVVVERSSHDEPWTWPPGISPVRSRAYGAGTLWYGRLVSGLTPAT